MTVATRNLSSIWSTLGNAPVRFITDQNSGCLFVERANDEHALSAAFVREFAQFTRLATPGSVFLLDVNDRVTESRDIEHLGAIVPSRFDSIHALCFSSALTRQLGTVIRHHEFRPGIWEASLSADPCLEEVQRKALELCVLLPWLRSVGQRPTHDVETIEDSDQSAAQAPPQSNDDDDQSHKASSFNRLTALRDRLRNDIEMINAGQWANLAGNSQRNPSAALGKYKAQGRLFAVPDGNRDMYPMFQFSSDDASPKKAIAQILQRVPEPARGWPLLSWFNAENVFLKNRKPLDVIGSDPEAVADAADRFFGRDD